jgi:hypothetical protein
MNRTPAAWRAATLLAAVLALPFAPAHAPAGVIVGHNPTSFDSRYDRFSAGYPNAPVPNPSPDFIGSPYDLSGIGWKLDNPTFSVSLVSPRHFIGAAHVGYAPGSQLNFFDPVSNTVHTYTVQTTRSPSTTFTNSSGQQQTLPSDVILGTLTAPIATTDHVTYYPVLTGPASAFTGAPMLNHGQNPAYGAGNQTHLGRNNVTSAGEVASLNSGGVPTTEATRVATYAFDAGVPGEFYLIGGDSGGPSFIPVNGKLGLLGGHYGVSNATMNPQQGDLSVDTFLPAYIDQLNAFMATDTDSSHPNGYALNLVPVPEPGHLLLIGLGAGALVVLRRLAPGSNETGGA